MDLADDGIDPEMMREVLLEEDPDLEADSDETSVEVTDEDGDGDIDVTEVDADGDGDVDLAAVDKETASKAPPSDTPEEKLLTATALDTETPEESALKPELIQAAEASLGERVGDEYATRELMAKHLSPNVVNALYGLW